MQFLFCFVFSEKRYRDSLQLLLSSVQIHALFSLPRYRIQNFEIFYLWPLSANKHIKKIFRLFLSWKFKPRKCPFKLGCLFCLFPRVLLLLDVAIISLPRSISRLAALRARASVCVSVYVCFYASASAPRAVFCRNEIASVNLNACFFVFASSTSGTFASSLLTFCAERSASCSLRLSSPSQLTRVHAPVCVCMCVALCICMGVCVCVYVDALRSKFVLQAPTVYFQTRDITSSLHSHTAIHSINFCPPP